jgi:hypothetical protein
MAIAIPLQTWHKSSVAPYFEKSAALSLSLRTFYAADLVSLASLLVLTLSPIMQLALFGGRSSLLRLSSLVLQSASSRRLVGCS